MTSIETSNHHEFTILFYQLYCRYCQWRQ